MENRAHALAAGLFVVAITALLIAMALWLRRDVTHTNAYEMVSQEAVTGLQVEAPVRFKGVAVGKVTAIGFDPTRRSNVLITLAINDTAPVTQSTFATLAFQGVTGLSFVQLDDNGTSSEPIQPGPDGVPRIPLHPNALGQITDQVASLMSKLDHAIDGINHVLSPENQASLSQALVELNKTAQSTQRLTQNLDRTLTAQFGPQNTSIPKLVEQTTAAMKATEETAVAARRTLTELDGTIADARQGLARVTGPDGVLQRVDQGVGAVTQTTLPGIQRLTTDATHTLRRLDRVANTVDENPQALLYGSGKIPPGPGEPGYVAPAGPGGSATPNRR
jgi:phospholipid/cholesterol/gamma-HCH transport system substrate-binding protein